MNKRKKRRIQNATLCVVLVLLFAGILVYRGSQNKSDASLREKILATECDFSKTNSKSLDYEEYRKNQQTVEMEGTAELTVNGDEYADSIDKKLENMDDGSILTSAEGTVSYEFDIEIGRAHV